MRLFVSPEGSHWEYVVPSLWNGPYVNRSNNSQRGADNHNKRELLLEPVTSMRTLDDDIDQ